MMMVLLFLKISIIINLLVLFLLSLKNTGILITRNINLLLINLDLMLIKKLIKLLIVLITILVILFILVLIVMRLFSLIILVKANFVLLCSSCGIKSQKIKTQHILEKCINVNHRHITFTIPDSLCHWFFNDLTSTDLLFKSVSDTLYSIVNGKVKKRKIFIYHLNYTPGFFAFLHTFGRPLNFNVHIHVIIAEYVVDKNKNLKKFNYFNYEALSKRFMKILLDKMEKYFGKSNFKDTKNQMYLKCKNGFYVNNKLEDDGYKFNSIEELIRYLTRYCSRPAMAESRILNYDGENVTFYYSDHTN